MNCSEFSSYFWPSTIDDTMPSHRSLIRQQQALPRIYPTATTISAIESLVLGIANDLLPTRLKLIGLYESRGDSVYERRTLLDKAAYLNFTVEIMRGLQGQNGFQVQPRRWVVERTFAWLMRYRRLVLDYEQRLNVSEALIYIALGSTLLHRMGFR